MVSITPIILAGGSGQRLWPLSRKSYPKQFSSLLEKQSLFQKTVLRFSQKGAIKFNPCVVITNSDFRFIAVEQMQSVEIDPGPILIEPEGKNTAPAILAACQYLRKFNEDEIVVVAPSDHLISDIKAFVEALHDCIEAVDKGKIVTFGIDITRPETGYGYLQLRGKKNNNLAELERFIEKPQADHAKKMMASNNHLWNAGIFMFRTETIIKSFEEFCPSLIKSVNQSITKGYDDLGFFRLARESWANCENISIDYAIMEKSRDLICRPFLSNWSDLGGWDVIWQEQSKDEDNNVLNGNATAIDCSNVLLRSESSGQELVGLGLKDIIAIAMPDAVLVSDRNNTQNVRKVVKALKEKGAKQAELFPKDHRPWGWFEALAIDDFFQVKRIFVRPGESLSLQSHKFRSEHWVVVKGQAKVTVDKNVSVLKVGQSIYVPKGSIHRMENVEEDPMILIEVQTGTYLGEDDIIRYEDIYKRT